MITVRNIQVLGVILAILLIYIGVSPFIEGETITLDTIATLIILVLIAVAYLIILAKPQWAKAVLFFEGIIIGVSGYMLLSYPYNIGLGIVGLVILIIAILAYLMKLPKSLLKFFYR